MTKILCVRKVKNLIPTNPKWILKNLESNEEFSTITALNDTLYGCPNDIHMRFKNHNGITYFIPTEIKPIKFVYESKPCFTEDAFNKLIESVEMSGYNTLPRIVPKSMISDINNPLGETINDSISALVEAWAALGKTIYNPDGTEVKNLKITNYTYDKPVTKITWSDGTTTKTSCNPNEADQFTGFLSAICKKLCPEYLDVYEKYTVTIPKEQAKKEAEEKERERIAEKKKAKLEKWRERKAMIKAAKELADEYERKEKKAEIEKIAVKKFGVPPAYFGKF